MSRRASLIQKQNPEGAKKSVRFPPDLVFLDSLKDNDLDHAAGMLRRASLKLDINAVADSGLTPLHQAVINENLPAVRLLVNHGADVNARDEDSWTPLHAAAAVGSVDIIRFLLQNGADPSAVTAFDERPVDLCDSDDINAIGVLLDALKRQKTGAVVSLKSIMKIPLAKTNSLSPPLSHRRLTAEDGQTSAKQSSHHNSSSSASTSRFSNLFSSSKTNTTNSTTSNGSGSLKLPASKSLSKSEQNLPIANNSNTKTSNNTTTKHK